MEKYHGYYEKNGGVYAVLGECRYKGKDKPWSRGIVYLKDDDIFCISLREFEDKFSKSFRGKYG